MKKNILNKIIIGIVISFITIEIGMLLGYYFLSKIDYNKFESTYNIKITR